MNQIFIACSAIIFLLSAVFVFLPARRYVLFSFVAFSAFSPTLLGLTYEANLSIAGKLWSFLDLQLLLLLFVAYPLSRGSAPRHSAFGMDAAFTLITLLILLNLTIGLIDPRVEGSLNLLKRFMAVPVYFVAIRLLNNKNDIRRLYKFVMWFTIPLFVFHVVLALRIYIPPMYGAAMDRYEHTQFMTYVRPHFFLSEPYYIIAATIAICHLLYDRSRKFLPFLVLILAVIGALLTQTRGIYVGLGCTYLGILVIGTNRIKTLAIGVLAFAAVVAISLKAGESGINIFARFTNVSSQGKSYLGQGYLEGWRGAEYWSLLRACKLKPTTIVTGHPLGAMHTVPGTNRTVPYFHNDYLMAPFSLGFLGLLAFLYVIARGIFRGRHLCRDPAMALLLVPVRVSIACCAVMALFNPVFWQHRQCGLIMCLFAISRNAYSIVPEVTEAPNVYEQNNPLLCHSLGG